MARLSNGNSNGDITNQYKSMSGRNVIQLNNYQNLNVVLGFECLLQHSKQESKTSSNIYTAHTVAFVVCGTCLSGVILTFIYFMH